jgi:phage terminase large subunit-like protein
VPKKNGKSTLLAGLALYMVGWDGEQGSECYGAAADREQAGIIYREAASMVRASPSLSKVLEVIDSRKTILHRGSGSFYRVLSADAFRAEGLNIHCLLFDELHSQRDRRLWDALRYGGASRRQPLLLSISTAGFDRKSLAWEQRCYAERCIADPTTDPAFYGCIHSADIKDDWKKPKTWRKANPSLGQTITEESFAADAREADASPSKLNSFLRYRLNVWTTSDVRWLSPAAWSKCTNPLREDLASREWYAGLDLASTYDLSAFVMVSQAEDGSFDVMPYFWVPENNAAERATRDKIDYLGWIRDGHIRATDGNVTDYDVIRRDIVALSQQFNIRQVAIDRWNATQLATQLQGEGLQVVGFGQGFGSMSSPSKQLENLVLSERIRCQSPVMDWMAGNVAVQTDHMGNLKPSKAKSTERIDGIVALVMGLGIHAAATGKPPGFDSSGFSRLFAAAMSDIPEIPEGFIIGQRRAGIVQRMGKSAGVESNWYYDALDQEGNECILMFCRPGGYTIIDKEILPQIREINERLITWFIMQTGYASAHILTDTGLTNICLHQYLMDYRGHGKGNDSIESEDIDLQKRKELHDHY